MLNDKAAQIQLKAAEGKNMKAAASAEPDNILQKYLDGVRLLDKAGVDTLSMQDLKSAMFQRALPGQETAEYALVA